MKSFVLLLCAGLIAGCANCPQYQCRSQVNFMLDSDDLAIFAEGDTGVRVCVDGSCVDFTLVAGSVSATTPSAEARLTFDAAVAKLSFFTLTFREERAREVKLTLTRDAVERSTHAWPAVAFKFVDDQSLACSQNCVGATVTE